MEMLPKQTLKINGKDDGTVVGPQFALANTQPSATSGWPWEAGLGVPVSKSVSTAIDPTIASPEQFKPFGSMTVAGLFSATPHLPPPHKRPQGQVKLFKIIVIDEWGFTIAEAARVLGFERAAELEEVLNGVRPVGQRDANDRLRATLRIAADLDALYRNPASAHAWLNQPHSKLNGSSPKALLTEGSMENLLLVKYLVAHLSGR